jgi:hypothetical protein
MPRASAFVTPPYPVLFTVASAGDGTVPEGQAEILLALLIAGMPSFLATHGVPEDTVDDLVVSLQGGDARVQVVGTWVDAPGGLKGRLELRAAAFITLVCADGVRITVGRLLSEDPEASPDTLARHVVRQLARGVQVPDLVGK